MSIINTTNYNVSVTYTADGVQTVFSFPFDYLRKAFVYVEFNESIILTQGEDYEVFGKTVVFPSPPTVGTTIRIYRETSTSRLVSWADASVLRAKDMTIQQIQELHIIEEIKEWVVTNCLIHDGKTWEVRGFPLKNVGEPMEAKDATNKTYVDNLIAGIVAQGNNIIAMDSVSSMRATDLAAGMTVLTHNYNNYNDKKSAIYYIRDRLSSDVIDGTKIVRLSNNNIAERIANIGVTNMFYIDNQGYICQEDD